MQILFHFIPADNSCPFNPINHQNFAAESDLNIALCSERSVFEIAPFPFPQELWKTCE